MSERFEILVEPGWIDHVAAHARNLGVSTSAYIRMATNRMMQAEPITEVPPATRATRGRKPKSK